MIDTIMDSLFGGWAAWFGIPAVVGTLFFIVRLGMMATIGDADLDVDVDVDGSDDAMKVLSVQSIATFMMGFGWGGLAALRGFDMTWAVSLVIGIVVGVAMVWLLGLLLKAIHDMQSSGNVNINDAMGREGSVYANIPAAGEGRGRVTLVLGNRQRRYNAISDGETLSTGTQVRVVKVNSDNSVTVTKA